MTEEQQICAEAVLSAWLDDLTWQLKRAGFLVSPLEVGFGEEDPRYGQPGDKRLTFALRLRPDPEYQPGRVKALPPAAGELSAAEAREVRQRIDRATVREA